MYHRLTFYSHCQMLHGRACWVYLCCYVVYELNDKLLIVRSVKSPLFFCFNGNIKIFELPEVLQKRSELPIKILIRIFIQLETEHRMIYVITIFSSHSTSEYVTSTQSTLGTNDVFRIYYYTDNERLDTWFYSNPVKAI